MFGIFLCVGGLYEFFVEEYFVETLLIDWWSNLDIFEILSINGSTIA